MIAANELRIGNWVHILETEYAVKVVGLPDSATIKTQNPTRLSGANRWFSPNQLSGADLSLDILEKSGFEKDYIKSGTYEGVSILVKRLNGSQEEGSSVQLICYPDAEEGIMVEVGINGNVEIPPVKYLHTLQNLFFALTGKELEISLNK